MHCPKITIMNWGHVASQLQGSVGTKIRGSLAGWLHGGVCWLIEQRVAPHLSRRGVISGIMGDLKQEKITGDTTGPPGKVHLEAHDKLLGTSWTTWKAFVRQWSYWNFVVGAEYHMSQIINAPKQDARKHNLQGNVKRKMRSCQPLVFVGSADSTSHGWSPHWLNLWIESAICTFLIRNSSIYGVWYLQEVSEPIPCRYQATIVYIYFSWIYWLAIND